MNEVEAEFLAAIQNDPNDAATRKIFADWLEDRGEDKRAEMIRNGVVKVYGIDFRSERDPESSNPAFTLPAGDVCDQCNEEDFEPERSVVYTRKHIDGWTISGVIHQDWFEWVGDFVATHSKLGMVQGNFESLVFASSEEAFQHFYSFHSPDDWDYDSI